MCTTLGVWVETMKLLIGIMSYLTLAYITLVRKKYTNNIEYGLIRYKIRRSPYYTFLC